MHERLHTVIAHGNAVLERLYHGGRVRPAEHYEGSFGWDTGAESVGLMYDQLPQAQANISYHLAHQWRNGMIPSVVYDHTCIDTLQWNTRFLNRSQLVSRKHTSGITQPLTIVDAAYRVGQRLPGDDRTAFWRHVVPAVVRAYEYRFEHQNPDGSGLIADTHPFATGRDNAPDLMDHMRSIPWRQRYPLAWRMATASRHFRADLKNTQLNNDERSSVEDGIYNAVGLVCLQACRFDPTLETYPFWVQDVGTNAIAARGAHSLRIMAAETDMHLPDTLQGNLETARTSFQKLYDPETGYYLARDALSGKLLPTPTIASLMALDNPNIPKPQAERLIREHLLNPDEFWLPHGIPSVPYNHSSYEEMRFWRGPVWAFASWIVSNGVERFAPDTADVMRRHRLGMYAAIGAREYASALRPVGGGTAEQSWTAAVAIDDAHRLSAAV